MAGYGAQNSSGGQLLDGAKEVELFNEIREAKAAVGKLGGMSAHPIDLLNFLSNQDTGR
jgi:metallo-beta-lactamase family protein